MSPSAAVLSAFSKSASFVDKLDRVSGPISPPEVALVEDICGALWERKGKRLRSRLVFWFGEMCGVPETELETYAWAAEAIHTASLLHDDVVDKSEVRRGEPSANALYDNTLPVLAGDYLFSDAIHQVALAGNIEILRRLCRTVKDLAQGECLQYETRYKIPLREQIYFDISRLKTSSLLRWAGEVGPLLRPTVSLAAVGEFLEGFGAVFQFSDDLLDVHGCPTKERWSDLREGKLNWVTWKMVMANPDLRKRTEKDFAKKTVGPELVAAFTKAAQREEDAPARAELAQKAARTESWLKEMPPSVTRDALAGLVHLCLDRTY